MRTESEESVISSVELDEVVERALVYYKGYMEKIKNNPVLGVVDPEVKLNAGQSEQIASDFLESIEKKKNFSAADGKDIIEKFVVIMSVYCNYLDSIKDSIYPPFRNSGRIEPSIQKESNTASKKMYEFYGLLTEIMSKLVI